MLSFLLLHFFSQAVQAQYPPKSNLTTIVSPVDGNITISYKSPPKGTCATAFDTQKQYTGWVNIPGDYPSNIFFWFIEGRDPTDHLTVWLNGGPGSSSMHGLFTGNGPCEVVELTNDTLGTMMRQWGWDRGSNMLYIDQVRAALHFYQMTLQNKMLTIITSLIRSGSPMTRPRMALWTYLPPSYTHHLKSYQTRNQHKPS